MFLMKHQDGIYKYVLLDFIFLDSCNYGHLIEILPSAPSINVIYILHIDNAELSFLPLRNSL